MTEPDQRKIFLLQRWWANVRSVQESERAHIRSELFQVRGLIPILMKPRNGEKWSKEDREILLRDLRSLSHLSPYLIPLLMPGGVFMLPILAWWLDLRRKGRRNKTD